MFNKIFCNITVLMKCKIYTLLKMYNARKLFMYILVSSKCGSTFKNDWSLIYISGVTQKCVGNGNPGVELE